MARNTLLISQTKLQNFTDLGPNYNARDISNSIRKAQDQTLRNLLGGKLMERLQLLVQNEQATPQVSPRIGESSVQAYKTLLDDYIADFLIYSSYLDLLETLYVTPRTNGLAKRGPAAGLSSLTQQEFNIKAKKVEGDINYYGNRLEDYLIVNSQMFPEYTETQDLTTDNVERFSEQGSPLFLKSSTKRYRDRYGY